MNKYSHKDKENYFKGLMYAWLVFWYALSNKGNVKGSKYWFDLFYYGDTLLNALTGGNPDVTVSGRTGYYNLIYRKKCMDNKYYLVRKNYNAIWLKHFWGWMMWIIDTTFEPIDGENHCYQAYEGHIEEFRTKYGGREAAKIVFDRGNNLFLGSLLIFSSMVCILIYPFLRWVISKDKFRSKDM